MWWGAKDNNSHMISCNLRNLYLEVICLYLLFAKSLSWNLKSSATVLYSKCVISKWGGNLSGLIITINHMVSCNLQNVLLKVWNLVHCIISEISNWGSLKRCHMASCNSWNLYWTALFTSFYKKLIDSLRTRLSSYSTVARKGSKW